MLDALRMYCERADGKYVYEVYFSMLTFADKRIAEAD